MVSGQLVNFSGFSVLSCTGTTCVILQSCRDDMTHMRQQAERLAWSSCSLRAVTTVFTVTDLVTGVGVVVLAAVLFPPALSTHHAWGPTVPRLRSPQALGTVPSFLASWPWAGTREPTLPTRLRLQPLPRISSRHVGSPRVVSPHTPISARSGYSFPVTERFLVLEPNSLQLTHSSVQCHRGPT